MVRNLFSIMNSETRLEGSAQESNSAMTSYLKVVSKLDGWILAICYFITKVNVKKLFCSKSTPIES